MKRTKTAYRNIIILFAMFFLLGLSCKQVEAKLNTGNITATSQRFSSVTTLEEVPTWAVCPERFIPMGTEVSICWDDIGLDYSEKTGLKVTIVGPDGKEYKGPGWTIYNFVDYGWNMVGWRYIEGPGYGISLYSGPFTDYNIDAITEEVGVKFAGYAAIIFDETAPTGLYTGTVEVGDDVLTTSWYMIDKPINIQSNLMDQNLSVGNPATFTVSATGSHLSYQWFYNTVDSYEGGIAIEGATDASYTIDKVSADYDGRYYYCQISNYSADDEYKKISKYSSRAQLTVKANTAAATVPGTGKKSQTVKKLNITGKLLSVRSKSKRKITIKWKKLKGISGYQIYISKDKKFRRSVIRRKYKAKRQSVKISNLLSGKRYYVRLRPYKNEKSSVIYGNWSKVKKVKVK